jgi:chloramphenicol O-acetyltransferase type A
VNSIKTHKIADWDRREYYDFFRRNSTQYYSVSFECDVTGIYVGAKEKRWPLYPAMIWAVSTTVSNFRPLRQRLILAQDGEEVVAEYDEIHPLFTVPNNNGYYNYCFSEYQTELPVFCAQALKDMDQASAVRQFATLIPERADMVFMSCIPNLPFTSVNNFQLPHSYDDLPVTMPMIVWGKITERNKRRIVPINVAVNHIFCDGKHLGDFYQQLQELFISFDSFPTQVC